jgi:hypothetical protein
MEKPIVTVLLTVNLSSILPDQTVSASAPPLLCLARWRGYDFYNYHLYTQQNFSFVFRFIPVLLLAILYELKQS